MRLGFRKRAATGLFAQCERLYAANQELASEDVGGCADHLLNLVSPESDGTYVLAVHNDPERYYGLFPSGQWAGHGSFIKPDGEFLQHGRITQAGAYLILATCTPVPQDPTR